MKYTAEELERELHNRMEWIADPGHAWLRVPMNVYVASGVHASPCSYTETDYVYLEEDCDAPALIKALGLGEWYIPRREFPYQQRYNEMHPRDMKRLVDSEYVNPFAHLYN